MDLSYVTDRYMVYQISMVFTGVFFAVKCCVDKKDKIPVKYFSQYF